MVAVAAAKFETLASTRNSLAPLRVRDSKIKTKKTCQKNKNCYLASMTQAQFHQNVFFHYYEAARQKRIHPINQRIEGASGEMLTRLEKERKKFFRKIDKEALAYEPTWNGRESLREPVDKQKMLTVLSDMKKRE